MTRTLQDLADRGKLYRADTVRDSSYTRQYRKNILKRAEQRWITVNPEKFEKMKLYINKLDADHLHELQLGGIDHASSLWMLDKQVNRSLGSQIRHQLADTPIGTKLQK